MDKIKQIFEQLKVLSKDIIRKYIVQKFFKGTLGGLKGWFVDFFLNKIYKLYLDPAIDYIKRQSRKILNKKKAKDKAEAIKNAENADDLANEFSNLP